jgi:hypothetical protein
MDEAFHPLSDMVVDLVSHDPIVGVSEDGTRLRMTAIEIDSPIELDVTLDEDGKIRIGLTPPIYGIKTGVMPSFHQIRLRADEGPVDDGQ